MTFYRNDAVLVIAKVLREEDVLLTEEGALARAHAVYSALAEHSAFDLTTGHPHVVVDILFDGPPGPKAGRFIDTVFTDDDAIERGCGIGQWSEREDGRWALSVTVPDEYLRVPS